MNIKEPSSLMSALDQLRSSVEKAAENSAQDARSATLSTAGSSGIPSSRTVSIEGINDDGPIFFANEDSGKIIQIKQQNHVSLCFYWPVISYQIIVEGTAHELDEVTSDKFWQQRDRDSQLVAWASNQAPRQAGEASVQEQIKDFKELFDFQRVPRPHQWRAYVIKPTSLDFWQGGWRKGFEKLVYIKEDFGRWSLMRINP